MTPDSAGSQTLLLTGIEESDQPWQHDPAIMNQARARYRALADATFTSLGGVLHSQADSEDVALLYRFADTRNALVAACAFQRALHNEPWPDLHEIRARVGLHCGAHETPPDGAAFARLAAIRSAAHGGETLASRAVYDRMRDDIPADMELRILGRFRLVDLQTPEALYQTVVPDLFEDYPPPRTLDTLPNNLPPQISSFVGREREIEEIGTLLRTSRLVTLTGSGGAGKSRLAVKTAAPAIYHFLDGVFLAELAALDDPRLVWKTVAVALGVAEQPGRPLSDTVIEFLRSRCLLLLLDNCEHLLDACATLCASVLRTCPRVHLLATSRERLNIPGEWVYRVPSLRIPDLDDLPPFEDVARNEAVRLFVERARTVQNHFAVAPGNAATVVHLCRRLDGIPLAIELAAARLRAMTVEEISRRLDDRFRLLTGGSRAALPRQQTLRALVDWSYSQLRPEEQALLRRLAVFAGGWTLSIAEAVCPLPPRDGLLYADDILDLLDRLVDKSLVVYDPATERYRLLETIREYARERLRESDEEDAVRTRHRDAFLALTDELRPALWGPEQDRAFARLEAEQENLRTALAWTSDDPHIELEFVRNLGRFWDTRGHLHEGKQRLQAALEHTAHLADHPTRAHVLMGLAWIHFLEHDAPGMRNHIEQARQIYATLGDANNLARATLFLGDAARSENDLDAAFALYAEAGDRYRGLDHAWGIAVTLTNLAEIHIARGVTEAARPLLAESLLLKERLGDTEACGITWYHLAVCDLVDGDWQSARERLQFALRAFQQIGGRWHIARSLDRAAEIAAGQEDWPQALALDAAATELYAVLKTPRGPQDEVKRTQALSVWQKRFIDFPENADAKPPALSWEAAVARFLETP